MAQKPLLIFVCEHGAAKSIIAAAYFNKMANEGKLSTRAIARGTNPDQELSPRTIEGLQQDGLIATESTPQKLTLTDIESAERIVTFCEVPEEYHEKLIVEHWNGIPPVSEDYEKARDAILAKLTQLINSTI